MGEYDDPHGDFRDDDFAFDVECSDCGVTYDNRDDGCPACGSSSGSYFGADAARWNDHLHRTGRW
jgi:hypothetical protein